MSEKEKEFFLNENDTFTVEEMRNYFEENRKRVVASTQKKLIEYCKTKGVDPDEFKESLKQNKMSEEKKYYTPTIEEFCIGLTFETDSPMTVGSMSTKDWTEFTIDKDFLVSGRYGDSGIGEMISLSEKQPDHFRVKSLDQEDFESEGFKVTTTDHLIKGFKYSKEEAVFVSSKEVSIWYEFRTKACQIARVKDWEDGTFSQRSLFKGTLRNISELRTILKQIGV